MKHDCKLTAEKLGPLWMRARVSFETSLTPEEVQERLAKVLPRFEVATGRRVPHLDFSFPTTYSGWVRDGSFMISGPRKYSETNRISIEGSIKGCHGGSMISFTAYNVQAIFGALISWTVGIILGICAAVLPEFQSPRVGFVVAVTFGIIGVLFFASTSTAARTNLNQLVGSIETIIMKEDADSETQ
jgi:hypothetical protein